jgi:hypothetical protein
MTWLKNKYQLLFFGFFISILLILPSVTKWGKTTETFISGDGLGYYAYLPAIYIYQDKNFEFKWFNEAYHKHYSYDMFGENNNEFFVKYKNRTINKYYQGLSFLWTPFFLSAHVAAKFFDFPQDGFSYPYQLGILLATVCYLLLGLYYLRKLLRKMFHQEWIALIIPIALFYGTYLLWYTFYLPSHSHVYSFTFITIFMYYLHCFFNEAEHKWTNFLWALFCFILICCLRPLNGLIGLTMFAFIPNGFFKKPIKFEAFKKQHFFILFLSAIVLTNQLSILFIQTGTFFPDTYSNERFYFANPKLFYVLFSYHMGLFVYIPLAFLALFGIFYLDNLKQKILFPLTFFIIVYLYSAWWYWPITPRTLVDFYVILAILLGALFKRFEHHKNMRVGLIVLLFLTAGYFRFKSMQMDRGILDKNYTHASLFWKNFFRTDNASVYAIPPSSILKQISYTEDFEGDVYKGTKSEVMKYDGKYAAVLNDKTDYTKVFEYPFPSFFSEKGLKKIRFSFWSYCAKDIQEMQLVINILDKENTLVKSMPYYLKEADLKKGCWDLKEFGYEFTDAELINQKMDHVNIYLWNNEIKNEMYIDCVKTEFVLTDRSFEIVQD